LVVHNAGIDAAWAELLRTNDSLSRLLHGRADSEVAPCY
jgi:hypothetical protein